MKKILLIEDNPEIVKLLHLHMNTSSFQLTACNNGKEATDKLLNEWPDLIILDIMLPDISGLEICKRLREQRCDTPILMLTSLVNETDKVLALELGADDYVTKPFSVLELLARIKALLRRSDRHSTNSMEVKKVVYKDLVIDIDKRKASIRGRRLDLTPKEFDLLHLMATNPGKSFKRSELLEKVWSLAFQGYEHTVTAHINRLRIKLESDVNKPEYILTSWGTGYRFAEENV